LQSVWIKEEAEGRGAPTSGTDTAISADEHARLSAKEYDGLSSPLPLPLVPVAQQPSALVSTGLQLAYDDSRLNQPATSTSGRTAKVPVLFSLLADDISAHLQHENEDIQRFMRLQVRLLS
jgi:hypothetical protein